MWQWYRSTLKVPTDLVETRCEGPNNRLERSVAVSLNRGDKLRASLNLIVRLHRKDGRASSESVSD